MFWELFACHFTAIGSEASPQTQDPESRRGVIYRAPVGYPVEDITDIGIAMCKCLEVTGNHNTPSCLVGLESGDARIEPEMAG